MYYYSFSRVGQEDQASLFSFSFAPLLYLLTYLFIYLIIYPYNYFFLINIDRSERFVNNSELLREISLVLFTLH